MTAKFRENALELLRMATAADEARDYEKALPLYQKGVEQLFAAAKYESSERLRAILLAKSEEMLSRAEKIKANLAAAPASTTGEKKSSPAGSDVDERLAEALRSAIVIEKPSTTWADVAGLDNAKAALKEAVELPMKAPQLFSSGRLEPWKGILLFGPPGTGKTQLARAVANSVGTGEAATFISASAADLCSRYVGDNERLVRQLFKLAREQSPSIIFLDEIDSLMSSRSEGENDSTTKLKTEFLTQMDGVNPTESSVLVLAATNRPWVLDRAILRRFEKKIMIDLPDANGRYQCLKIHLKNKPNNVDEADLQALAAETDGWSGSELRSLVKEAAFCGLRALQTATRFVVVENDLGEVSAVVPAIGSSVRDDSREMSLTDVESRGWMPKLALPPVSIGDLRAAMSSAKGRGSLSDDDANLLSTFTITHGMRG